MTSLHAPSAADAIAASQLVELRLRAWRLGACPACVVECTHRRDHGVCVLGVSDVVGDITMHGAMASLRRRFELIFVMGTAMRLLPAPPEASGLAMLVST